MGEQDHVGASADRPIEQVSPQPPTTNSSRRAANLVAIVILLFIFLTPVFGFWWLRSMAREAVEWNALSHTRDMLSRYMARTHGQWPSSWNDLKPDLKPVDVGYGTKSVKELKRIVTIDFDLDPQSVDANLRDTDEPPRIIWLRDRPDTADVQRTNARLVEIIRHRIRPKVSDT